MSGNFVYYSSLNMSGHSKWSTIKHQKAANDAVKGRVFSKLSKAISIAVKVGGSPDPSGNARLKVAIEQARAANMPKVNIERAIKKASEVGDLVEIMYEGFGPGNTAIMVDVATDNKNRTAQEIKSLFDRGGGSFAGTGSVAFNFQQMGQITLQKQSGEDFLLDLIDAGVEDYEEDDGVLLCYVPQEDMSGVIQKLEEKGIEVKKFEVIQKPVNVQKIDDVSTGKKLLSLLDKLENHDDVQNVYSNFDIDDELFQQIESESE